MLFLFYFSWTKFRQNLGLSRVETVVTSQTMDMNMVGFLCLRVAVFF
jgi:hypothetical protein